MIKHKLGIRHVEAFRAVMSSGSMTVAARALHTSQPQVSRLIAQLETITQFPLFARNGNRVSPTEDAIRFHREVEKTFAGIAELESVAADIRSFSGAQLRVASTARLAGDLVVKIVTQFLAVHPEVLVSIHSGNASDVNDWIRTGVCDVGLVLLAGATPGINAEHISTLRYVAVLPKGHFLADLKEVTPEHLGGIPFISPTAESLFRSPIEEVFVDKKPPRIVAKASLGSSVCALVRAGLGVSLVNELAARDEYKSGGIEIRPFSGDIPITVSLLYRPFLAQPRLVESFSKIAKPVIESEIASIKRAIG
ncbi:LysR substrate-binding domain-containing protein [Paraburkholderia aspalathi]|uniref:DNA-binding transcriptional regulator, LysR family n=1 Tax=Paraburkholderia aspalathi TaxID=1324617 RepID=A0A1I7ELY4_9BURK|nr:LysR substrate-binding domain-containing protein [Paraburkholderia aspalathi]SFU24905.1 DNA-binding transcriptional regulator, LysR family [Paraburkholderia aspalathi]